jgi:Zn-dependent metalloprotease
MTRSPTKPPRRKAAKATKAKPAQAAGIDNGLAGFSVDTSSKRGAVALARARASGRPRVAFHELAGSDRPGYAAMDPESAARHHLDSSLAGSGVAGFDRPATRTAQSEFKAISTEPMALTATTMVKFRQTLGKIPVYGSLVVVELGEGNDCLSINSTLGTPDGIDHVAKIAPAQALAVAAEQSGRKRTELGQTPRLHWFFEPSRRRWHLAYIIEDVPRAATRATGKLKQAPLMDYVVDAHSGKLLASLPRVAMMASAVEDADDALAVRRRITVEALAGGKRRLRDASLNVTTFDFGFRDPSSEEHLLPGKPCLCPPVPWDGTAVAAHANTAAVAAFLRDVLKRNSYDGKGGEIRSSVNCWDREESAVEKEWQNAFWNGSQMVYGQIRFPDRLLPVAAMLDIVAHELFHAVTDTTSHLEYRFQSGALNESYSDIFGVIVANFHRPLARWTWRLGKGFGGPGTYLRNFARPTDWDQPMHMDDYIARRTATPNNDYGEVHANSGIHNYAAYRIMRARAGGAHVFEARELAALFYVAMTTYLSRSSNFSDSRRAVLAAAKALFRNEPAPQLAKRVRAIERGFAAAGITA